METENEKSSLGLKKNALCANYLLKLRSARRKGALQKKAKRIRRKKIRQNG